MMCKPDIETCLALTPPFSIELYVVCQAILKDTRNICFYEEMIILSS